MKERDWADDETMSAEETMRRFEALDPQPGSGPKPGQHVFTIVPAPRADDEES
jgi:hypothetical protein